MSADELEHSSVQAIAHARLAAEHSRLRMAAENVITAWGAIAADRLESMNRAVLALTTTLELMERPGAKAGAASVTARDGAERSPDGTWTPGVRRTGTRPVRRSPWLSEPRVQITLSVTEVAVLLTAMAFGECQAAGLGRRDLARDIGGLLTAVASQAYTYQPDEP